MARRSRDPYGRDSAPASPGDGRINAPLGAAPSSVPTRRLSSASLVSVPTLPSYRSRQKDDSTDSDASIDSRDDEKAVAAREQEPLVGYLAEEHRTGDDGSWRPGRTAKVSASGKSRSGALEELLATAFDVTHGIEELENDVDQIVALRNKIVAIKPSDDLHSETLQSCLATQAQLVNTAGRKIVMLENALDTLLKQNKDLGKAVKAGRASYRPEEISEVRSKLSSAKVDFADAMERIREGAWKEQRRRERVRIWIAGHIREREPYISDDDVDDLLKRADLGSAKGVAKVSSDLTSYPALYALANPFTELATLTDGMRFMNDGLDDYIQELAVGRPRPPQRHSAKKGSILGSLYAPNGAPTRRYLDTQVRGAQRDLEAGWSAIHQQQRSAKIKRCGISVLTLMILALLVIVIVLAVQPWQNSSTVPNPADYSSLSWSWTSASSSSASVSEYEQSQAISAYESAVSQLGSSISGLTTALSSATASAMSSVGATTASPASLSSAPSSTMWWTPPVSSTSTAMDAALSLSASTLW